MYSQVLNALFKATDEWKQYNHSSYIKELAQLPNYKINGAYIVWGCLDPCASGSGANFTIFECVILARRPRTIEDFALYTIADNKIYLLTEDEILTCKVNKSDYWGQKDDITWTILASN